MELEAPAIRTRVSEGTGLVLRAVLTVGLAAAAVFVVVGLAGREAGEPATTAPPQSRPPSSAPATLPSEFRLIGMAAPSAYLLLVGSEAAQAELMRALGSESFVRQVLQEPARVTWVIVLASDEEAAAVRDAVARDASIPVAGPAASVAVIDLR